jgi:hypothetical protein
VLFEEAVRLIRAHVEGKFPKTCKMCGRLFLNLPDYIRGTRHVGQPVSYDADLEDWRPREPLGTYALAVCRCGTSLTIDSSGISLVTLWRLMRFARGESRRRGITVSDLLAGVRVEVHRQVLTEDDQAAERAAAEGRAAATRRPDSAG